LPGEGGHGRVVFGERLNEVTVELRAKYKSFLQAIVEKLADNARLQRTTKLKKILQDTREAGGESDIRERMQPLNTQVVDTISHLHDVFTTRVFVAVCRGYWDRMARVLSFSLCFSIYLCFFKQVCVLDGSGAPILIETENQGCPALFHEIPSTYNTHSSKRRDLLKDTF
jgi:hypothetical protein